jgi:predicted ABC-type ATPase
LGNPFLLMIAGPNGAGKTTLIRALLRQGVELGEYINADDIAGELQGSYDERVRQAQVIADRRREACIEAKRSFSFETVMSHPSKVDVLVRSRAAGFFVQLFFVGIDDPQTNIDRVQQRVAQGGHDVPQEKIATRWSRTMALLHEAIKVADQSFLFDNSAIGIDQGPKLVLAGVRKANGTVEASLRVSPPPLWLRQYVLAKPDVECRTPPGSIPAQLG